MYEEFQDESLGAETHTGTRQLGVLPCDFERWQEQHGLVGHGKTQLRQYGGGHSASENGLDHFDQRRLIEQFQHWQIVSEADSERHSPQEDSHGVTHGLGTTGSTEGDHSPRAGQPFNNFSRPVEPVTAWGLSPSLLLLLNTYTGSNAIAEREQRIDAALGVPSDGTPVVEPPGFQTGEASGQPRGDKKRNVHQRAEASDQQERRG